MAQAFTASADTARQAANANIAPGPKPSVLDTIGRTPIVRLNNIGPKHVELYAKLEAFNPMGSVKDRLALGVIEAAEQAGLLQPGQTVVEGSSGNTGIGLAMVCAQKGYPLVVVMAENFSIERRKLLRFLGAKVVLTPASEKGTGMIAKARELAETHGWFLCRQFENEANADMHSRTTAREILADFAGLGLDYWVTGFGTGGTLKGVSRVLKAESPQTTIVVAEPDNSQILASGIAQTRQADGSAAASHPSFRPHPMQGWSPDFIPKLTGDVVDAGLIDRLEPVSGAAAMQGAKDLATKEGIFAGITGGATLAAALRIAKTAQPGARILAMIPDTGERYLSTPLFDDVSEDMTEAEQAISASTPLCRFDVATASPTAVLPLDAEPAATAFVEDTIGDPRQPVVMFALEWCEFCWSVRKLFAAAGIPFRSVDLDSGSFQAPASSTEIRKALFLLTGAPTIPQVFVGCELIGGATDAFDAFNCGALQTRLEKHGVPFDKAFKVDAYSLLPKWLHPR